MRRWQHVLVQKIQEVMQMFSSKKFWYYCWGTLIRPVPTLKQLASEPSLAYPFAAYFLFGLLYGVFALVGYFSGHTAAGSC
jgi:hypothetical protein